MHNQSPHLNVTAEEFIDVLAFLNFEEMVERVIHDIFQEMISLPVQREEKEAVFPGPLLASMIEFSGVIKGNVHLHTSMAFARKITSSLTGMPIEEIEDDLVADTIGEVTNMVSGNLHTDISNTGMDCELRVPQVARADVIPNLGPEEGQSLNFSHGEHQLQITICLARRV